MVENLQREDLNALDKATAFREYLAPLRRHPGGARRPARPRPLDRLEPDPPARPARRGPGRRPRPRRSARATPAPCSACPTPTASVAACQRVIAESLSVRQTEALVATGEPTPRGPASARTRPTRLDPGGGKAPHFVELEQHLHQRFGTPVLIRVKTPRPRPDHHRLQLPGRIRPGQLDDPRRRTPITVRELRHGRSWATELPPARPRGRFPRGSPPVGSATRLPLFAPRVRASRIPVTGRIVPIPRPIYVVLLKSIPYRRLGRSRCVPGILAPGLH